MGHEVQKPNYQGLQKYPGILATVITIAIGVAFLGALYQTAHSDHGGHGDHSEAAAHEEAH
ncbi:MAG: hypothetical protein CMK59_12125 [Proteobacteria bacterium]|nr:hypothetical protein [Pseudomonadota bacterium]|tara:strand:+ start:239 stop:421 length:183 start_codon:yes stop_codon:yes gene_type:complete